jgi:hypothetical protein
LSLFHVLHTPFFRQFAPELVLFSLGSRGMRALLLFLFWKKEKARHARAATESGYVHR